MFWKKRLLRWIRFFRGNRLFKRISKLFSRDSCRLYMYRNLDSLSKEKKGRKKVEYA